MAGIRPPAQAVERTFQITEQIGEATLGGVSSPDQHIIVPRPSGLRQDRPRDRAQPALDTIASHGISDLAAHGKADAHVALLAVRACRRRLVFRRRTASRLQDEPRHDRFATSRFDRQKLTPGPQRPECRHHGVKQKGACVPWHDGWRAPGDHQRWPCGRGNRADAYGRAHLVDRCASQLDTPLSGFTEVAAF